MKNYKYLITLLFILTLLTEMVSGWASPVRAQSENGWTDPINLSNSGSSKNPWMVIDSEDTIHVFWFDEIDGYQYTASVDGVEWSKPKTVKVPFPDKAPENFKPVFLADANGNIHILWLDHEGILQYRKSTSSSLGDPSTWKGGTKIAETAVQVDAVIDSHGALHVGYINNTDSDAAPAGVYYRRFDGTSWSAPVMIYPSKYFRSLVVGENANIHLATSIVNDKTNVYIVWDDRAQRRILLAKSLDQGENWEAVYQVRGPEDFPGAEIPFNIALGTIGDQVLLLWQAGIPGGQCTQYSQWSVNNSEEFSQPVKIINSSSQCPQSNQSIPVDKDLSIVSFQMPDELALIAWNGSRWSDLQVQSDISSFINPATFNNVSLGCQSMVHNKGKLYLVGCDEGSGGDIWFSSRSLGTVNSWFPPPSEWTSPVGITILDQKVSYLTSAADHGNNLHAFWVQPSASDGTNKFTIQYGRWDGKSWSDPTPIITDLGHEPLQLATNVDGSGRIFLSWVDGKTGELLFVWASVDRANRASEWEAPQYIASNSQTNTSPDIVTDDAGTILVAYAVPINEQRGIYFIESNDAGNTWSQPYKMFDASSAGWDVVDRPRVCLSGDGRLHALFSKYSFWGNELQSQGLYYIQSINGGATWSEPEAVSENSIQWSDIVCSGQQTVHRIWQEENQSYFVNLDQVSQDGGTTWNDPVYITSLSEKPTQVALTSAGGEQLAFLQTVEGDSPALEEWAWDSANWKLLDSIELHLKGKGIPSFVTAGITPQGSLGALISTENQDPTFEPKYAMIGLSRSLPLPENAQFVSGAVIPTPAVVATAIGLINPSTTPVTTPSMADISGSTPRYNIKNVIGLALVGGLVVLLVGIFFPWGAKVKKEDKTPQKK